MGKDKSMAAATDIALRQQVMYSVFVRNYSKACEEAMTRLQGHYNSLYGDDARNVVGIFGQKKLLY